jgi:hypothetical protein
MTESPARASGRVNIAFTAAASEAADRICRVLPFEEKVEVARIGAAYALRSGMPLTRPEDFGRTTGSNYNIGSVDPKGELLSLIGAFHPECDEDPARVLETLMSKGVLAIAARIDDGEVRTLRDLIALPEE